MSAVADAPRRRSPAEWLGDQSKLELALWAGLVLLALGLRLYDLGARPFHHDESQDAYFSWLFSRDFGAYSYDPLLHGPFRFFLTAGVYKVFGASDFTARLAPALMGMCVVILPFFLRRQLGRIAAFTAALLFAIGPSYLYYSRFAREDIYFAALSLALIVVVWRYLERPTRWGPSAILGLVALMFTCKETAFISMAVAGVFFIPAAFIGTTGVWDAMKRHGWRPWLYGVLTFLVVWGVFFGVFFTQWGVGGTPRPFPVVCEDGTQTSVPLYSGFLGGFLDGIDYWLAQQCVARGGEEGWLYPAILLGDEWPTLLLGLVGAVWVLLRPTTMRVFLVVAFVGQMALYVYASERFAWLVLHPLLPLVLLAALAVQALWRASRTRGLRIVLGVVLAAGLLGTVYSSFQANARLSANPRELLVTTQSDVDVKRVAQQILRLGRDKTIAIDSADATFPFAWYLRDTGAGYPNMTQAGYQPDADVLVMTEAARTALADRLGGYQGRQFQFRVWWVREWKGARSIANWFDYIVGREPWNPTGGLKAWLYLKR